MAAIIHTSAHLQAADRGQAGDAPSTLHPNTQTVWVSLGSMLHVYPASPEQAESIALAFQDAAQRLRGDQPT